MNDPMSQQDTDILNSTQHGVFTRDSLCYYCIVKGIQGAWKKVVSMIPTKNSIKGGIFPGTLCI